MQRGLQVPSGVHDCMWACVYVGVYVCGRVCMYVCMAAAALSWLTVSGSCVVDVWVTRCQTGSRTET